MPFASGNVGHIDQPDNSKYRIPANTMARYGAILFVFYILLWLHHTLMLTTFLHTEQMASKIRKIGNKILKPYVGCIWTLVTNIAKTHFYF